MLTSIEGNFDHPEVNKLLKEHFIELRAASPEGSAHVLDIPGLKVSSLQSSKWVCEKATQYITLRRGDNKDDKICSQIDAL